MNDNSCTYIQKCICCDGNGMLTLDPDTLCEMLCPLCDNNLYFHSEDVTLEQYMIDFYNESEQTCSWYSMSCTEKREFLDAEIDDYFSGTCQPRDTEVDILQSDGVEIRRNSSALHIADEETDGPDDQSEW